MRINVQPFQRMAPHKNIFIQYNQSKKVELHLPVAKMKFKISVWKHESQQTLDTNARLH